MLACRTGPASAEGQHQIIQDLISDLTVQRARSQDPRDLGHPGGRAGLQAGPQRGHPGSGEGVHSTASDAQRGRGLGLGQVPVILQRDHVALVAGQVVQRSRDDGRPQDDSPALGAWHARCRSAVQRRRRGTAQLRLGHEPQVGFRVFAVHPLSVLQPECAANVAAITLRLAAAPRVRGLPAG